MLHNQMEALQRKREKEGALSVNERFYQARRENQ